MPATGNSSGPTPRELYMHLDMRKLLDDPRFGAVYDKASSSVNDRIYKMPNGDKISIKSKTRNGHDIWCIAGSRGVKRNPEDLLIYLGIADTKRKAFDYLYELAGIPRTKYRVERKPDIPKETTGQLEPEEVIQEKILPFVPAPEHPFFLDRGITKETLQNPLFKDRFGASDGPFGYFEEPKNPRYKNDDLVFPHHVIIPYTNIRNEVVALEAKNRLKNEVYQHKLDLAIRNNESINSIRQNVNQFYLGTSPANSVWCSNIPQNPSRVLIFEQPADALAYHQINSKIKPDLNNSIYLSTGGNLKRGQIPVIKNIIQSNSIKQVDLCFDNDVSGLNYALELEQGLLGSAKIYLQLDPTEKFGLRATLLSGEQLSKAALSIDKFKTNQKSIASALVNTFGHEAKAYFIPTVVAGDVYGYLTMPYTSDLAAKLFRFNQVLSGNEEREILFTLQQPEQSKDWNDKLRGLENVQQLNCVHLADFNSGPPRLHLAGNNLNTIIVEHKVLSFDRSIQETIGEVKFYEDQFGKPNTPKRISLSPYYVNDPEINKALDVLERDVRRLIPVMDAKWLNMMFNEHISYSPLTREFIKRKDGVIAKLADGTLQLTKPNSGNLTAYEQLILQAKSEQVLSGQPSELHGWHFLNNRLYNNTYDNKKLRYDSKSKTVFQIDYLGKWDYAKGQAQLYRNANPEKQSFDSFVNNFAKGQEDPSGQYIVEAGVIKRLATIATWNDRQFDLVNPDALNDSTEYVLSRFKEYLLNGRNPNRPGWLGTLDSNYIFHPAPGFDPRRDLSPVESIYYNAFLERLRVVQKNVQQFRDLYPETRIPLSSEGSELRLGNQTLYVYDHLSGGANTVLTEQEFITRNFHPNVYKAVGLFIQNKGAFFNYPANAYVNLETYELFYKNPELPVGKIVFDDQNIPHLAFYNNSPDVLKRELTAFSALPVAELELLNKLGIKLDVEAVSVKQKRIDLIPAKYLSFFERGKFQFFPKEQLERKSKSWQERYNEAYIWQKTYLQTQRASLDEPQPLNGLTERGDKIFFKRLCIGQYDPVGDRLVMNVTPRSNLLQELAIIEKAKVKDITHRQFSYHLVHTPEPPKAPSRKEEIERVLDLIDVNEEGMIRFLNKDFRVRDFGFQYGDSLLVEKSISESSKVLHDAMQVYAKGAGLTLEFVDALPQRDAVVQVHTNLDKDENLVYRNNLRLTEEGILKALATCEDFRGMIKLTGDNRLIFNYLPTAKGSVEVPYGEGANTAGVWMSNFPKDKLSLQTSFSATKPALVVCEKPELALLHYQDNLRISIHQPNLYVSFPGKSLDKQIALIEGHLTKFNIRHITFVGSTDFTDNLFDTFRKDTSLVAETVTDIDQADTLAETRKAIATTKPSDLLQYALNQIDNSRILNIADGIAMLPVFNSGVNETAIIGEEIKPSFIKGPSAPTIWISQVATTKQDRVVIAPNHKEAIFYMAMNGDKFNNQETVISLSDKPTEQSVKLIKSMIALPRHRENLTVVNTKRLAAELVNFKLNDLIPQNASPGFDTMEQQFADHMRKAEQAEVVILEKMSPTGNGKAPVQDYVQEPNYLHDKTSQIRF